MFENNSGAYVSSNEAYKSRFAVSAILKNASDKGLNIEYMYAMTRPIHDKPVMIMSFKDIDAAERILG